MEKINLNDLLKVATYAEVKDFGRNQANRKIDEKHVNEFIDVLKNYKSGLVYSVIPVVVNKATGNVLDGQHRLEAYIRAVERGILSEDTPILIGFEDIKDNVGDEKGRIVELNCKQKAWRADQYYDSYAITEESYARLKIFAEGNDLCFSTNKKGDKKPNYRYAAAILKGKNCASPLKRGEFRTNDEEIHNGKIVHDELLAIRNKLNLTNDTGIESMAVEWFKFRDKINLDSFLKKAYIQASIRNSEKKNAKNWEVIFSLIAFDCPAAA